MWGVENIKRRLLPSRKINWVRVCVCVRACVIINWPRRLVASRLSLETFKLINIFNAPNVKRCQRVKCDRKNLQNVDKMLCGFQHSGNIQFDSMTMWWAVFVAKAKTIANQIMDEFDDETHISELMKVTATFQTVPGPLNLFFFFLICFAFSILVIRRIVTRNRNEVKAIWWSSQFVPIYTIKSIIIIRNGIYR